MNRLNPWLMCVFALPLASPLEAAPDASATLSSAEVAPTLPESIHGWNLRDLEGTTFQSYGHKRRDLTDLIASPSAAYLKATGMHPAPGLIIVTEGPKDVALLAAALRELGPENMLLEDMDFGDDLSLEQALGLIPIPLPREAAARLLAIDQSALSGVNWVLVVPSAPAQKRAMKTLVKEKMKEEGVNLALRLLMRPFLGKLVSVATEAMQSASQAMVMQQWLDASGLSESEAAAILQDFESKLEAEIEKKAEAMAQDLEASAGSLEAVAGAK